jgi:hypothetical protein
MALKIRSGAEDMPDGLKHIETDAHTTWKRTYLFKRIIGNYFTKALPSS